MLDNSMTRLGDQAQSVYTDGSASFHNYMQQQTNLNPLVHQYIENSQYKALNNQIHVEANPFEHNEEFKKFIKTKTQERNKAMGESMSIFKPAMFRDIPDPNQPLR